MAAPLAGMYMWKSINNFAYRSDLQWQPVGDAEMRMYGDFLKIG